MEKFTTKFTLPYASLGDVCAEFTLSFGVDMRTARILFEKQIYTSETLVKGSFTIATPKARLFVRYARTGDNLFHTTCGLAHTLGVARLVAYGVTINS